MQSFVIDGIVVMPPLVANYQLDPTIETLKENLPFEQGHNFEYHNFLYNIKDTTINKSSAFVLADKVATTDYFDIKEIPFNYPVNITTFLACNSLDNDPMGSLSAVTGTCITSVSSTTALSAVSANNDINTLYMTIDDTVTSNETGDDFRNLNAEKFISRRTQPSLPQRYYFNIMLINAVDCYVYHLAGEQRWYLSHKDEPDEYLKFTYVEHENGFENLLDQIEYDGGEKIKFQYNILPSGHIRLYKQYDGQTQIVQMLTEEEQEIFPNRIPLKLTPTQEPDNDENTDSGAPNINELTEFTTFKIRPPYNTRTINNLKSQINNYDTSISNNNINISTRDEQTTDISTNYLVHSEYYFLTGENIPINFYSLKNDQTPYGITLQNNLDPRTETRYTNRDYEKIDTGTNQLDGSTDITLEYKSNVHTYEFHPGMNYFNLPQDIEPYNKININDSNIIESGSLAGSNPAQSDKIYKQQKSNDLYNLTTRWGTSNEEQLGTWLCTWLSGSNDPLEKPIWVDRFYNPSKKGYVDALTEITDYVHNKYKTTTLDIFETVDGEVVDIKSNLTLEPGKHYAYYRIKTNDIENNLSILDPFHVQEGINQYKTISNTPGELINGDTYIFDGKHTGIVDAGQSLDDIEEISLTFDINLKKFRKTQNHQIIGNYTTGGIGFFQRNDVSPFIFLFGSDGAAVNNQLQNSSIRIYDNNFKLYNYITNDNYLQDDESPSLFHTLVIRETPEELFILTDSGDIIELTHDGIILSKYSQWVDEFAIPYQQEHGILPRFVNATWDERYIYLLSHTGETAADYTVHEFDMVSKTLSVAKDRCKIFNVDVPAELAYTNNLLNRGRLIGNSPPNQINISDGTGEYKHVRTIYLSVGDSSKNGNRYIWSLVRGSNNELTNLQERHDLLYCFDKHTLETKHGLLTDNNLLNSTTPLSIIDYAIDSDEKIWIIHNENILSVFTETRKLVKTTILEEQQGVSLVITRDFTSTGVIEDKVCLLGNTTGDEVLQMQIGPFNHPTNNPSATDWRKASPWIQDGNVYDRSRYSDITSPVYDDLSSFDQSTQILYPFIGGGERFGTQAYELIDMPSNDPAGRVLDGDYELITEGFDIFVNESVNVLKGNIFDAKTCNLQSVNEITNFTVNDLQNLPQLVNHYEYSVLNFNRYTKNNLNCKINLFPMFMKKTPDKINFKIDLDNINNHPSTGFFNVTVNISNKKGLIDMWINGQNSPEHIYKFDKNKYIFSNLLSKKIIVGATPFLNETLMLTKLNKQSVYIVKDVEIKNIHLFNKYIEFHEILNLLRRSYKTSIMYWGINTKKRNYIETIERMFNHSIPPRKANMFDVVIRNSSIRSLNLQNYIANKVDKILKKITPAGTRVRNIEFSNEILDFVSEEQGSIDYNPVADEIIVDPSGVTLPAYLPYVLQ